MGYCISVDSSNFSFSKDKSKNILRSVKEAVENKKLQNVGGLMQIVYYIQEI